MNMEEKKRELILKSGRRVRILGETRRYYICEGTQFSKANPDIVQITETEEPKKPRDPDKPGRKRKEEDKEAAE